jgi:hypothetical protein
MNSYLGVGASFKVNGMARRPCANMLCTDCTIRVSRWEGYRWLEERTSYLFFRSNFGDFARLKAALEEDEGCCAYSCGCKGHSADEGMAVPKGTNWKCTGCDI